MASSGSPVQREGVINFFAGTEGIYHLPHHPSEIARLHRQHALFLVATGGVLVTIPLQHKSQIIVLDSGASDGTWLLDLPRLYPEQEWSLHGVDIGSALFPPKTGPYASLDLRAHDIRSPIPEDWSWTGSFDFVHQRLLVWGLDKHDWPLVIRNHASLLKPGGWIQLVEAEWIDHDHPTDAAKCPIMAKMFRLAEWTCNFGTDVFVAYHLEDLLKDAGFRHVQKTQFVVGYGASAKEEQWRQPSAEIWVDIFKGLATKMPAEGIPGVARTPEEFYQLLDELPAEMVEWGYHPKLNFVIGQKPETVTARL